MLNPPKLQSQRDPAWKLKRLGISTQTIGSAGCAITSLSMLNNFYGLGSTPDSINEELKANGGYYQGNLVVWSVFARRYGYKSYSRSTVYNNFEVWKQLNWFKRPVLVEMVAPKGVPGGRHWGVFLGSQKWANPWTGQIESTAGLKCTGYCVLLK